MAEVSDNPERGVLEEIRRRGLRIVPRCEFIAGFLGRNPEFADLVA
jgi:predicted GNAT family acetyltransferase